MLMLLGRAKYVGGSGSAQIRPIPPSPTHAECLPPLLPPCLFRYQLNTNLLLALITKQLNEHILVKASMDSNAMKA
jgi:hypothetical protein